MRVLDFALASAFFGSALVLAGCPNKDNAPTPEPAATVVTPANTGANDKAGADAPAQPAATPAQGSPAAVPTPAATPAAAAPAAKPKKHEDQGGW